MHLHAEPDARGPADADRWAVEHTDEYVSGVRFFTNEAAALAYARHLSDTTGAATLIVRYRGDYDDPSEREILPAPVAPTWPRRGERR